MDDAEPNNRQHCHARKLIKNVKQFYNMKLEQLSEYDKNRLVQLKDLMKGETYLNSVDELV